MARFRDRNSIGPIVKISAAAAHGQAIGRKWLPGKTNTRSKIVQSRSVPRNIWQIGFIYTCWNSTRVIGGDLKPRQATSCSSGSRSEGHSTHCTSRAGDGYGVEQARPRVAPLPAIGLDLPKPLPPQSQIQGESRVYLHIVLNKGIDSIVRESGCELAIIANDTGTL